jgi:HK97 family phage major capsid protein
MENSISTAKGENALIGSSWIMSRKVFNYLRKKKDDNGNPIYQKPGEGQPGTIWDRPYIISDKMPTTDAVSTPFLILGNPKYWLHGNRVGMQFQTYNNTIRNLDYDQIFYKFRIRQGFIGAVPEAIAVLKTPAS